VQLTTYAHLMIECVNIVKRSYDGSDGLCIERMSYLKIQSLQKETDL